ncbi:DUF1439 domain-containing protein [Caenimonas soli]|uniref:DUF1439 domain-containing protein n=1 Tax=Caenimonas soli TaxID=2735555 RepID=UPI001552BFFB|nr:DUF1439 domain-containing protein [Caenimonas soli]NPC55670.1 DUF1439 domain-containing protein [Caenimonas soli]
MKRRIVVIGLCLVLGMSHAAGQPQYKVSAEQLQQAIGQRFPVRHKVEGLLNFDVQEPRLRLLPEQNRIASEMLVDVAGPALRRSYTGALELDFELRYEPADQSIRAYRLQVHSLRLSGLPPRTAEMLEAYGPRLAEQSLREVVLHRLRPKDLALADTMGLQPSTITVTSQGLVVGFETKQAR